MALIATVNGQAVYSDKRMSGITNSRITFTDGSWCDVSTGQVHNNGSGYINIGGSDTASESQKVTVGPKRFAANALEIHGVNADVRVETHSGSDIEYTVAGPADQVESIRANVLGSTLVIKGDGSNSSSSGMTIIGGNSRTVISGGGSFGGIVMGSIFGRGGSMTVISGGNGANPVKLTISVPKGTPVNSHKVLGNVVIGDTDGPLIASVQAADVSAGRVTSAQLTVQGSGDISVNEVSGAVTAHVQGSGDIEVESGSAPSLNASVQGSGDIKFRGSADTASLKVKGSGDIRVAHVRQKPLKSVMGSGDIKVKRVG